MDSKALLFLLLVYVMKAHVYSHWVAPICSLDEDECHVKLDVYYKYTMMHYEDDFEGAMGPFRMQEDVAGIQTDACSSELTSLTQNEQGDFTESIVTGDGSIKLSIMVNGQIPGQPITVYEGTQMVIETTNKLESEIIAIHFHGLHQEGTPFMDGVPGITQCGINPGETFTYRVLAANPGTYWYHSHVPTQRTMGFYGPLIILPRSKEREDQLRKVDPLPTMADDYFMMVQDVFKESTLDILHMMKHEAKSFAFGYEEPVCYQSSYTADHIEAGVLPFYSAMINGYGQIFHPLTDEPNNPFLEWANFRVETGGKYRFRAISAAMTYPFIISIDNHQLHVIAADGRDVVTRVVDSLVVSPGERFDFYIEANDPLGVGNYWVRAQTLERWYADGSEVPHPGHVEGILHYVGAYHAKPLTNSKACSQSDPCVMLNCPFMKFPDEDHTLCLHVDKLRSAAGFTYLQGDVHEINLSFGKTTTGTSKKNLAINGLQFVTPVTPPIMYNGNPEDIMPVCDSSTAANTKCTHIEKVPLNKVIQLNLQSTSLKGNPHPIHLHGTHFEVLKLGYPVLNEETFTYDSATPDLVCLTEDCSLVDWADPTWKGGNVPGVFKFGAAQKDTLTIPLGGYAVVRFKATNPGYWALHCHTEFHNEDGMLMILQVGEPSDMNNPPPGMNTCGDFTWSSDQFMGSIGNYRMP